MTVVDLPGSKSITARALFLAACADGTSVLRRPLVSDDTEAFAEGLRTMGIDVVQSPTEWIVSGRPSGPEAHRASVYCRDAATAGRFLPTLAALGRGEFRFDASAQLRRRPITPLISALQAVGGSIEYEDQAGHLPLMVVGNGLDGGYLELDAGLSSQFLTALLLGAPLMAKGLVVTTTDLVSVPYVEMTVRMMRSFGVGVKQNGSTYSVDAQRYRAAEYVIEPDASTSSYFLAAAALGNDSVTVRGLGSDSLQGDVEFARVLQKMGADVELAGDSITITGTGRLRGLTVNMRDISDTMPTLAAIAPFADGPVRIEDVYNTRVKECDRLDVCAENLRALGIRVETGRDWIEVWPGHPRPTRIACHGDHRIAMAFSITGLRVEGVTLDDPSCVKKTFPEFHSALADLRRTQT